MKKKNIFGAKDRPRLSVYRSNGQIYAQIIDDVEGKTLASSSSLKIKSGKKSEKAKSAGIEIAKSAIAKKINTVVFDRGKFKYHGRVKALAEGAREGGLVF
ncbi:MAG: large subunit ribosomal protein L18 [Candidatus Saganbacteria bacterium]|uniref:Large ribosomal subunit protein uL18 n=1 Tax=Candidatus Saganbacteria bacterium TaxID=2575572 RepID=A0A833L1B1_UNCSA|nr:MAG: large subunit ribosomal protein L18 [Candidatus Saganbacteria bacterium]